MNQSMTVSNGDLLLLTVARYTLENKVLRGPVKPDEAFAPGTGKDAIMNAASNWVRRLNCPASAI